MKAGLLAFAFLTSLSANAATLIHSNDLLGDIEPCGCRNNPQGGMARKANLLKRLSDTSLLQLDAGDLLFSSNNLPEMLATQADLQASFLLKSMQLLHHDAVVPGEKDYALGFKAFEKLRAKSGLRFLAANLVHKNGSHYLDGSALFTLKGDDGKPLKVAVLGLVGKDLPYPPELKILPAIATAKKLVPALRRQADLVILLTHQGVDQDKALASAVPGIDIIIGGHTQSFIQEPLQLGTTRIYQSSFRNQYLGVLPLQKPFTGQGYKLVGLDAGYDSPVDAPGPTDALVKEFKKAVADHNTHEAATITPAIHLNRTTEKFQTFPRCAECHLKQFDFWRKTPHALALSPLIEKDQYKNKECLSCHSVGLGDPQGFSNVSRLAETKGADGTAQVLPAEKLADTLKQVHDFKDLDDARRSISTLERVWSPVQCENCHSPGGDHPFSGNYAKAVEKNACLKCHTAERAPQWYTGDSQPDWKKIEGKRALVTCPAGEL